MSDQLQPTVAGPVDPIAFASLQPRLFGRWDRTLQAAGGRFDCTGEAEFEIAKMAGADSRRCVINGNGKSPAMLRVQNGTF